MNEALALFAAATKNEIYDPEFMNGEWMIEAVETKETIDDFIASSNNYAECTEEKIGEIAGFKFVAFAKVQVRKGDRRRSLSIVDFGNTRFALDCDLTDFV